MTIKLKQEGSINFIQSGDTTSASSAADLRFTNLGSATSGTSYMTITTSGNVGISTTSPAGIFDINSDITVIGASTTLPNILTSNSSDPRVTPSASSNLSNDSTTPYRGFTNGGESWYSLSNTYGITGAYTGSITTNVDGTSVSGEWIQLYIPNGVYKITSMSHMFSSSNVAASTFCASSDGSNFTSLITDETLFEGPFNVPANKQTNKKYYYVRWIFRSALDAQGYVYVSDLDFTASYGSNLGIGTTNPSVKLHVLGDAIISENLTCGNVRLTNLNSTNITASSAQITNENVTTSTIGTSRITTSLLALGNSNTMGNIFTTGGNVGIGTTNPGAILGIATGSGVHTHGLRIIPSAHVTSERAGIELDDWQFGQDVAGDGIKNFFMYQTSAATTRFFINTSGNVGIGTTAPVQKLDIGGSLRITGGSLLATHNSNTVGSLFTTGGNVGIGNTAPAYKLVVTGDIYATGDMIGFSDRRLKTDISTIPDALNKVESMRGVYYTMTETGHPGLGLIAQEVQQVLPEVVGDRGEYLGVAYGNIVGVLVEAIKELSAKVKDLESKLNQ